jgi:hypothetical protein
MDEDSRSDAVSSSQVAAALLCRADSIDLDNVGYKSDGRNASCDCSRSYGFVFPRNWVSLGGVLLQVIDLGCCVTANGRTALPVRICIPSSVETVGESCFGECNSLSSRKFRQSHSNLILNFLRAENMHSQSVHHFHQFAFLPRSKRLANGLSLNASLFRQSHSNLILNFRRSGNLHFRTVHHFHQFAFLPLSKRLANAVSVNASLFWQSHSNLIRNFRRSANLHFPPVHHSHQFTFLPVFTTF